jgi:hypothetical protein
MLALKTFHIFKSVLMFLYPTYTQIHIQRERERERERKILPVAALRSRGPSTFSQTLMSRQVLWTYRLSGTL